MQLELRCCHQLLENTELFESHSDDTYFRSEQHRGKIDASDIEMPFD